MEFYIQILGSGSALPTASRGPSAQLVHLCGKNFLVDCGEGTQLRLRLNKIKMQKIHSAFISHLHGDHFFGLVGLISTMHLLGREKELHIYAPGAIENIIRNQLKVSHTALKYELKFHALKPEGLNNIYEEELFTVSSFPLEHRVPTWGFLFKEKSQLPKLKKSFVEKQRPTVDEIHEILEGNNYINEKGEPFLFNNITLPPREAKSYAYCSDTVYTKSFLEFIKDSTLLYHEASFGNDLKAQAKLRFHATAEQAALIAKKANAKQLVIGHFSARYKDITPLLEEAKNVFSNTVAAEDGMQVVLQKELV
jgi:ribonuclease Z